ncbi:MAG: 16S rRNA (guanine(966)-N(2))-methyltransferase RsmD [Myxococcales bacterium]|nr:16S rRNA (guanine(966)-N(2))-methyltransferase RsmD [Myxococcales bacterium]USN51184.1 MAG: 16S rRNA (guanine(966)-N(2))-methyltransferase RsmD [Myxococcales bacterium]
MPKNKSMRITGGYLVRRRFLIPELIDENVVRPTPDRVREAVFSMIKPHLPGSTVLDLFAGSGAHGFESLSRGASKVTFIEKNSAIAAVIKKNIELLELAKSCTLVLGDALHVVEKAQEKADVVFVDPPYSVVLGTEFFDKLDEVVNDDGIVVFRCFKKEKLNITEKWKIERDRIYGGTRVLILQKAQH